MPLFGNGTGASHDPRRCRRALARCRERRCADYRAGYGDGNAAGYAEGREAGYAEGRMDGRAAAETEAAYGPGGGGGR